MRNPIHNAALHAKIGKGTAIVQGVLGITQIIAATICLYFLLTRGEDRATFLSAIIAFLLMVLSITFKITRRFPRK